MAITVYKNFESFRADTEELCKVDLHNLPLGNTNSYYYHHVRPLIIPNPLVMGGIKLSSPCFLYSTFDENSNNELIHIGENGRIDLPPNTLGVMLKIENKENSLVKVTDVNGQVSTVECGEMNSFISLGFTSPNGISSVEFLNSNIFLCDMFFTLAASC
ncbi:hypothetical protein R9X47_23250 [Wukongibacter baidiensis]|uniref:hypothetical protein n=1 Tax=Wukongibacter baidiensis TaxID=1723361 RepID=UPI003D7F7E7D